MTNLFFNHTDRALENSLITDEQYNDNLDGVEAGFDLLPSPTEISNGLVQYRTGVFTANKYDISITDVTSYVDGYTVRLTPDTTNTAATQLQINSLGYINIKRDNLEVTQAGDFVADSAYTLTYVTASSSFILQTAPSSIVTEAAAIYDEFDDRYLGAKALEPSSDNDGNTLIIGALFFDTTASEMKVYTGIAWQVTNTYVKTVGDTPPATPYHGQEWFDTATGIDYTYFNDGTSSQWIQQPLLAEASTAVSIDVNTSLTTVSVTSTSLIDITTNVSFIDATSADVTATLPTAVGNTGAFIHSKRTDSSINTVTIDTTGSETIDDYTDLTLSPNQSLMVISDGTNWRIL